MEERAFLTGCWLDVLLVETGREHHGGWQLCVTALMLPPIPVPSPNHNLKCRK